MDTDTGEMGAFPGWEWLGSGGGDIGECQAGEKETHVKLEAINKLFLNIIF